MAVSSNTKSYLHSYKRAHTAFSNHRSRILLGQASHTPPLKLFTVYFFVLLPSDIKVITFHNWFMK